MILIDGEFDKVVELDRGMNGKVQQVVYTSKTLPKGAHKIEVINMENKLSMLLWY